MSVDLKQLWLRTRNTQQYSVCSADGEPTDEVGSFSFLIPPSPYPEHQGSQYAIFKLHSMYIQGQATAAAGNRVSESLSFDTSGFYVQINGLGIAPSMGSTITNQRIRGTNQFYIPNENAMGDLTNSLMYQRVSGGKCDDYSVSCSNPSGTECSVKIFDSEDDGSAVITDGAYSAIINFSIELLDVE